MEEEGKEKRALKIYFIPFLASGHMIPLCDIASLFASNGQQVTIITTPSNAKIINTNICCLHTVDFPSQQVGLPDGVESMSTTTDLATSAKIHTGAMLLQGPISDFVEKHPPDCIVADFFYRWVDDLAHKLDIPRLSFNGFSLFTVSLMESLRLRAINHCSDEDDFPHHITLCSTPPKLFTGFIEPLLEREVMSYGLIVNNFAELDGEECIEYYQKITGHKAWHLGPASLIPRTSQERGQISVMSGDECLSWLNSKRDNSVLYICFGSVCRFSDKQLYEMASGIEASGQDFIWVVSEKKGKEDESEEEKEKWLPKGFEERNISITNNKGMIIRGWAPQVLILGHPAVGAFLTHCGWNSTVEAVGAGVPMITWPVHGEQFYNEKLITQVRRIGVEVGATEWCVTGVAQREKVVGRDQIERAIRRLLDGTGDEAQDIIRRAQQFGEKARKAVQKGGSSQNNLLALIDDLKRLRDNRAK